MRCLFWQSKRRKSWGLISGASDKHLSLTSQTLIDSPHSSKLPFCPPLHPLLKTRHVALSSKPRSDHLQGNLADEELPFVQFVVAVDPLAPRPRNVVTAVQSCAGQQAHIWQTPCAASDALQVHVLQLSPSIPTYRGALMGQAIRLCIEPASAHGGLTEISGSLERHLLRSQCNRCKYCELG